MTLKHTSSQLLPQPQINLHSFLGYSKIACVDLETTGLSPTADRIIEVGVVLLNEGTITEHQWFIDPGIHVSPFIHNFTGIAPEDLEDAPRFHEISDELFPLLDGALFVAHNADFDYSFLHHSFRKTQKYFNPEKLCTVRLTRRVIPGLRSYNLDSVLAAFQIPSFDRHRALPDAQAVYEILLKAKNL